MPGAFEDIAAMFNTLLPAPGGLGIARLRGAESESQITRSGLTSLTDSAARKYNEAG